jgi:hypothetical protein
MNMQGVVHSEWLCDGIVDRPSRKRFSAKKRLGFLYERGNSVPKDYLHVYMWYKLGAASGGASGAIMRDGFVTRMTSDQLSKAKKLAREWKPKTNERPWLTEGFT